MRTILRTLSEGFIYVIFILLALFLLVGSVYIFIDYPLRFPFFAFIITTGYPLVCMFEILVEFYEYRKNIKILQQGYEIEGEARPYISNLSWLYLVIIMFFSGFVLLLRIITPESIEDNSAAYALILFLLSLTLHWKRKKEEVKRNN